MQTRRLSLVFLTVGFAAAGCKSSGTTGGPLASCPSNTPNDLISDFAVDNSIAAVSGRQGGWYTYGDDVGSFATSKGYDISDEGNPSCSGAGSLHIKGTGFAMWGAATGVDFEPRPGDGDGGYGDKMTYDASAYRGVAFWAKASAPLDGVQVSFPDLYTDGAAPAHDMPDPANPTGPALCTACRCIYTAGSDYNCSPYLVQFGLKGDGGVDLAYAGYSSYQLDTTWKRFQILFVDAKQDPGNHGYHTPTDRLDVAHLTAMAIQVNANYSTTPTSARDFEIWLDDVSFIK